MAGRIESYAEFWPFYLGQPSHAANRALHLAGTGAGIALLAAGLATLDWRPIVAAAVIVIPRSCSCFIQSIVAAPS